MIFLRILGVLTLLTVGRGNELESLEDLLNISRYDLPSWSSDPVSYFGNFDEVSIISYTGQQNFTIESTGSSLVYYGNDTFIQLMEADTDISVDKITPFKEECFILTGSGYLGGIDLARQCLFNLSTLSVAPIFAEALDSVNDVLVLENKVYFGGNFTLTVGNESVTAIVAWDSTTNSTEKLSFGGFVDDSYVNSIVALNNDNILFAGHFYQIASSDVNATNSSNSTQSNSTATGSFLQFAQAVPLMLADITGGSVEKSSLLCPSTSGEDGWVVENSIQGTLDIDMKYEINPSKIRIYNSLDDASAVSLFRVLTSPSNGIMNLTYLNPSNGELRQCDAWCPLLSRGDLSALYSNASLGSTSKLIDENTYLEWTPSFQEFSFVNDVPVSSLQFYSLDSYGSDVAIESIEIFESEFMVYANNTYNEPNCQSETKYSQSELSDNGWNSSSSETYVLTDVGSEEPYVIFYPNISYPGRYTINLYTPGCASDDTCTERGIVNVTVSNVVSGKILVTDLIYQTNENEKFDPLYSGYLDSAVKISMNWSSSLNDGVSVMVADKVGIVTESIDTSEIFIGDEQVLNGLYLYDTSNSNSSVNSGNSSIDQYAVFSFPNGSSLYAAFYGDELLIGGNFDGIAKINLTSDLQVASDQKLGSGGDTTGVFLYSNGVLFTGDYELSSGNDMEVLTFDGSSFNSFANLDYNVTNIVNFTISGDELLFFDNAYIFNVTSNTFISNTSTLSVSALAAGINDNQDSLMFGYIKMSTLGDLSGIVTLETDGTVSAPSITDIPSNSNLYQATYINESSVAYAFYQSTSNGTRYGLMLSSANSTSRVLEAEWTYPITTILYEKTNDLLAVGSGGTSFLSGYDAQLFLLNITGYEGIYRHQFQTNESVNSMVSFNSNSTLLVGGSYQVGSCRDLCLFDYDNTSWESYLNNSIYGQINQLSFAESGDILLIGGALQMNNETAIQLISVNLTSQQTSVLKYGSESLVAFSAVTNSTDAIIVQTESEIFHYENDSWKSITPALTGNSEISTFLVLPQQASAINATDFIILIQGNLNSTNFGYLNSMVYDGQTEEWQPYFSTASSGNSTKISTGFFFQDIDKSSLSSTQTLLTSNGSTSTNSSSNSTVTTTSNQKNGSSHKIDRGFIVLIGLALALATISAFGLVGALIAYFFVDHSGYEAIKPRIDQGEMLDTVPPEKLMKFI